VTSKELPVSNKIRHLPTVARITLGLVFVVFGLNGFLGFLPPPPLPEQAGSFLGALAATGYMFPLIKATEVVAGLLLLSNRWVALALVLLAPIVVNIVAFHTLLAPFNAVVAVVLLAESYLAWSYRSAFRGVLDRNARPVQSGEGEPAQTARVLAGA
jgi:uncharacterized membrane protein YphA (DoxX/SURF4 family)